MCKVPLLQQIRREAMLGNSGERCNGEMVDDAMIRMLGDLDKRLQSPMSSLRDEARPLSTFYKLAAVSIWSLPPSVPSERWPCMNCLAKPTE